jgi:hypothetical protein
LKIRNLDLTAEVPDRTVPSRHERIVDGDFVARIAADGDLQFP